MSELRLMAVAAAASLVLSGCMFGKLKDDIAVMDSLASIKGEVSGESSEDSPIFISLHSDEGAGRYSLSAYEVRFGGGGFEFLVPPGDYMLIAFEDDDQDFELKHGDNIGWHGEPTLLQLEQGEQISGVNIVLRAAEEAHGVLPEIYAPEMPNLAMQLDTSQLGEVVSFDDARFAPEVGRLGMWQPVKTYEAGYGGLFFLEHYDPDKIPVLFVHGISGYAAEWHPIIEQLDRSRFQPWVSQYPSGFRMNLVRDGLAASVRELKVRYGFDTLFVVAHSAGGLLSRGFINKFVEAGDTETIGLFITLSTPWHGHAKAQAGVDRAPIVVPVWYDLAPGSPYLDSLFDSSTPDCFPYYLLFSYRGKTSIRPRENSDGTVTLSSQLSLPAQEAAEQMLGFNEDHTSILRSEIVSGYINQILGQAASGGYASKSCRERATSH